MQEYENNPEYKKLAIKWQQYKDLEQLANAGRLKVEQAILDITSKYLKEKGTNHLSDNIVVTTGIDEKWDENAVNDLYISWNAKEIPELPFFPFRMEWIPDSKKIAMLKDSMPGVFNRIFRNALTIKPKKPSFSAKK